MIIKDLWRGRACCVLDRCCSARRLAWSVMV